MVESAFSWAWNRYRPEEGWLPFFLLLATVICLVAAVLAVEWVPEDGVVVLTAVLGLFMGMGLAKRPLRAAAAWTLILIYGLVVTTIHLSQLWPPLSTLWRGWWATSQYWRQNGALFLDRMGSWFKAAFSGGTSQETIVFAFGLGLAAWLLTAYAGWSIFRRQQPLPGLTLMGLAMAVNGYYGQVSIAYVTLFVGLLILITGVVHFVGLERTWQAKEIDYSLEIRFELILYSLGTAIALLSLSSLLPSIRFSELSRMLVDRPAVDEAEQTLERVFAGVQQPRRDGPGLNDDRLVGRSAGVLPRNYLLGNPPELYEIVVMTATVTIPSSTGSEAAATADLPRGAHWRTLSYDTYTGRGWALSEERRETVAANEPIPLPTVQEPITLTQTVHWLFDQRLSRYTLGLPLRFDQEVTVYWRGLEDLSRVQGEGNQYQARSRLTTATAADLQQTAGDEVPPAILARYTRLPDSVPERVQQLAQEVAGTLPTPYDQARALERFLRQYPYSLDVELPPSGTDPVDYFLFDLQTGYCDYYASTMVVMARSLGLPARLAVGFLAQAPDENGVQTIYQINGHSWAEVYFAGYGWVEFEPTAAFPSPYTEEGRDPNEIETGFEPLPPETPPIPERVPVQLPPWQWGQWLVLMLVPLSVVVWWLWQRQQKRVLAQNSVVWAYGRLQQRARQLGHPSSPSQTPHEFTADFLSRLGTFNRPPWLTDLVEGMRPHVERLTTLFVLHQYAGSTQQAEQRAGTAAARESWRRLRRPLWLLRIVDKVLNAIDRRNLRPR